MQGIPIAFDKLLRKIVHFSFVNSSMKIIGCFMDEFERRLSKIKEKEKCGIIEIKNKKLITVSIIKIVKTQRFIKKWFQFAILKEPWFFIEIKF